MHRNQNHIMLYYSLQAIAFSDGPQSIDYARDDRPRPPWSSIRRVDGERYALSAVHPVLQPAPELFQRLGLGLVDALVLDVLRLGDGTVIAHHPVVGGGRRGHVVVFAAPAVDHRAAAAAAVVRRRRRRRHARVPHVLGRVLLAVARLVFLHDHRAVAVVHVAVVGRRVAAGHAVVARPARRPGHDGHPEVGQPRVQAPDGVLLSLDHALPLVKQFADGPLLATQPGLEQQQVRR